MHDIRDIAIFKRVSEKINSPYTYPVKVSGQSTRSVSETHA